MRPVPRRRQPLAMMTAAASILAAAPLPGAPAQADVPPAPRATTCMGLPALAAGQELVVLSEDIGGYVSTSSVLEGNPEDQASSLTYVDVEPGEGGIVVVLESFNPTIFAFKGATDRVARAVILPMMANQDERARNRNAAIGLPNEKVTLATRAGCLPRSPPRRPWAREIPPADVAAIWGRPAIALLAGIAFGEVSLPSGRVAADPPKPRTASLVAGAAALVHPFGVAEVDPKTVTALYPVVRNPGLPGLDVILDAEVKGAATEGEDGRRQAFVLVTEPGDLPLWGEDLYGYLVNAYVKAGPGVTVPGTWRDLYACVVSADGGTVLLGMAKCRERGWTDAVAFVSKPHGGQPPPRAGCHVPHVHVPGQLVALLDDPRQHTDYAITDQSMPTHVARLFVEPGEEPLTVFVNHAALGRRVVYTVEGETGRVDQLVIVGDAPGHGTAILGLPAEKVTLATAPGCLDWRPDANVEHPAPFLAEVAASAGRTADVLIQAPDTAGVALPSGTRPPAPDAARTRGSDCRSPGLDVAPCPVAGQGYLTVATGPFVPADTTVVPYGMPRSSFGTFDLEAKGLLSRLADGPSPVFRVNADTALPTTLCPQRTTFVVPQGVTVPGEHPCACLLDEVTMGPLAGQAPGACGAP